LREVGFSDTFLPLGRGPPGAERLPSAPVRQSKGRASASRQSRDSAGAQAQAPIPAHPKAEAFSVPSSGSASTLADNTYCVSLPAFEGPLDLLLHLIQQHELDIFDIPVGFITEKYLEYLQMMRSLSIDVASEYLVMAATLAHIKSKMLLPAIPKGQEDDGLAEEEEDPRAELVRRLLEYQKYKAAALDLAERGTLGRDIFGRGIPEPVPEGPAPFAPLGVFSLLSAFEKILKRSHIRIDHEVVFDRISITDRIVEITETLMARKSMRFEDLLLDSKDDAAPGRFDVVITFLAILVKCRLRVIRVYQ
jgi:segregation and condensation protein A